VTSARFDELYERYSDGALTGAEREEFERLLGDAGNRARLVEISSYEAAVSEELRVARTEVKASSRSWPKVGSRRIPIQSEPDEDRTLRAIAGAAVAAAIFILILVFVTSSTEEAPSPAVVRPRLEPAVPRELPAPPPAPVPVEEPRSAPKPAPTPDVELTPRKFDPAPTAPPQQKPIVPAAPPAMTPPKPAEPIRESVAFIASFDRVVGEVVVGAEPAQAGKGIASGRSVSTGRSGYALVKFPDGTRVELAADTTVRSCSDGAAGKAIVLEQGILLVDAVKQPAGRPLVIATAQAESTVLGTQFVLQALPGMTRLDVREGRVKFTRLPQAVSSVTVGAGQYAVAGGSGDPVAKSGIGQWKAPPAGLQLWLRADQGVKLNGAGVALWNDFSPAGSNSAGQDKPGAQPTLLPNAHGTRPALRFDGSDDFLQLPDGFGDFRAGLTAFVVVRPAPGGAWSRFIDLDVGPACENIVFGRKDSADKLGFWVYTNSQTKGKVEAPGAVLANEVQSFCAVLMPGGRVTLYRNGTAVATGETSTPKNSSRKPNSLGKSNSGGGDPLFKGEMYEILLYNRALSEAERAYVESYLNAKYFDPTTPPAHLRPAEK
jgi:ferric-dicitrate binding protein FerR (iron transport regulator)